MGYGNYSIEAHRAITSNRAHKSQKEVFQQRQVHPLMNPKGVRLRVSRDSEDHPNSLPIIFALDVTGSMGKVPDLLARQELPNFMKLLLDNQVDDPQVMFMFVGDAASDDGPLQVGQFESTAETMDQWLTWSWLEGGGGGNGCESYDLAMYFAARHTETDSVVKRSKRGYFFMTGDEKPYPATSRHMVEAVIGDELPEDLSLEKVCEELSRVYHPFFIIPTPSRRQYCEEAWREVLGDHVICLEDPGDTCFATAALVGLCEGVMPDLDAVARSLESEGRKRHQIGALVRALTPFASTLGKDGFQPPNLDPVAFPS